MSKSLVLSEGTLRVLKNFATINQGIVIAPGNRIRTFANRKNVLGEYETTENFPIDFAIYDLNEFLGALSLFGNPQLSFSDSWLTISGEGSSKSVRYFYGDPAVIVSPDKEVVIDDKDVNVAFGLDSEQFSGILKAAQVLGLPNLVVKGNKKGLFLKVKNRKNESSNVYEVRVGDYDGEDFEFSFLVEHLKVLPGNYQVFIAQRKISKFENTDLGVVYYIALEPED